MVKPVKIRSLVLGLLGSTMLVSAGAAHAQGAATSDGAGFQQLDEIVVTAQKRSENLQKVPISLQALSPEIMEQHQVQTFDAYTKLLPSVSFQTLGPGQSQLFFRGIVSGKDGNPIGALPTSGVYLDETPVTTIGAVLDVHIYDVARVEALSGPQGTLFGASSLAGTLRIITNKPDTEKVAGGYDLQLNKFGEGGFGGSAEGFVNVPLNDRMAVRMVGFYQRDGGYIDNTLQTRTYQRPHTVAGAVVRTPLSVSNAPVVEKDFNDAVTYGGRIALGIELTDDWTITPTLTAQDQHTDGTFLYDPKAGDLAVHNFRENYSVDKWYQAAATVEGKVSDWDVLYTGGYMRRHTDNLQDYSYYTVAYDTVADANFFQRPNGTDIDPTQTVRRDNQFSKQTHEFRVSSPSGERLQVTAGAFFQRQTADIRADYILNGVQAAVQAPSVVVTGDSVFLTDAYRVDRDYAVFAQGDFKITPSLTLTAGLRGFKYRNTLVGFSGLPSLVRSLGCGTYSANCISIQKEAKGDGETHKLSLSWQVDPDRMLYATYSTGFRPGGINRPVGFAPYEADTLDNFEVGVKSSWLDRRLRVNAAVYRENWKGVQYNLPGANGVGSFVNAGDASVTGVEADVVGKAGPLTLSASGAYNDAKLTTPFCNMPLGVLRCDLGLNAAEGTRLPTQPKFKANATARYDFDLGGIAAFGQLSMLHQTGSTNFLRVRDQNALGANPGFTTFDLSFGGELENAMTVEFFVQNIFDKRAILSRNSQCILLTCLQNGRIYPVKPQLFGVKLGQRF